jgi:hypothetical protein
MTRPTRIEINCETLEETIIELTDAEIAELEARAEAEEERRAAEEAAATAAAEAKASAEAKLAALGLTADEVAAIIGR